VDSNEVKPDQAGASWVYDLHEDNRDGARHLQNRPDAEAAEGQDDIPPELDQFRCVFTNAIGVAPRRAIVEPHIATYYPA